MNVHKIAGQSSKILKIPYFVARERSVMGLTWTHETANASARSLARKYDLNIVILKFILNCVIAVSINSLNNVQFGELFNVTIVEPYNFTHIVIDFDDGNQKIINNTLIDGKIFIINYLILLFQ